MMVSLKDELIVVAGAASGIGLALSHRLASHGALLSLADLNETPLRTLAADLIEKYYPPLTTTSSPPPTPILTTVVDVTAPTSVTAWITATTTHFQRPLSGAANMAGVVGAHIASELGTLRNLTDAEFAFVMDVNSRGVFNCLRAQLPAMRTGSKGRGGGSIVNACSMAGLMGVERNASYAASKHAVAGLTRSAAKEEGALAIRVNAVAPGIIDTPMMRRIEDSAGTTKLFGEEEIGALKRRGDAEEVAGVVAFLLSEDSSFISGQVVSVDGGVMC